MLSNTLWMWMTISLSFSKTSHRCVARATKSNCCSKKHSTSFILIYSPLTAQSLTLLTNYKIYGVIHEQELVNRLDRVSRKYSLLIIIDKTKVMTSNGIACAYSFIMSNWSRWILPYVGFLVTKKWWVYDGIPYQVKQEAGDRGITAEYMEES